MKSRFKYSTTNVLLTIFAVLSWSPAILQAQPANTAGTKTAEQTEQQPELLAQELIDAGWISLFDGHSLYGWKPTSEANWKVVDGTITVDSGDRGFLRTTTQFADFELYAEFKAPEATNSGIFIRTSPTPKNVAKDCYEINIAPSDNPFPTGGIVGRLKGELVEPNDGWRTMKIVADGDQIHVDVDGVATSRYSDDKPLGRGFISLQLNKGAIAFRNIRLRPLNLNSLFNGESLEGWNDEKRMEGEFSVSDTGELQVKNGRGQLESSESFGDFVLQLECKTNADDLNSGIFFRCIPGDTMMGYESQIHNGFDGERTKPKDHGTGGIFRRQNARYVVADDQKWFSKTLIAEGPHIAAWVNGYQVSDWTDKRKPHENPRKGLRKEPGTFMIQAHDPTTDILFRNIRAGEMAPRR